MTALYWDDFDCTAASRRIAHPSTQHLHFDSERAACLGFLNFLARSVEENQAGRRYFCIRGPGGLVRGVVR